MDTIWAYRAAYEQARKLKLKQDAFCENVLAGNWDEVHNEGGEFPDDLQWEALVDVLRGRVKVHIHCYEPTDMDGMIRVCDIHVQPCICTNGFPIAHQRIQFLHRCLPPRRRSLPCPQSS